MSANPHTHIYHRNASQVKGQKAKRSERKFQKRFASGRVAARFGAVQQVNFLASVRIRNACGSEVSRVHICTDKHTRMHIYPRTGEEPG